MHNVLMNPKIEVILALKQFVKEIGTPKDIITHTSREEISQEVK